MPHDVVEECSLPVQYWCELDEDRKFSLLISVLTEQCNIDGKDQTPLHLSLLKMGEMLVLLARLSPKRSRNHAMIKDKTKKHLNIHDDKNLNKSELRTWSFYYPIVSKTV